VLSASDFTRCLQSYYDMSGMPYVSVIGVYQTCKSTAGDVLLVNGRTCIFCLQQLRCTRPHPQRDIYASVFITAMSGGLQSCTGRSQLLRTLFISSNHVDRCLRLVYRLCHGVACIVLFHFSSPPSFDGFSFLLCQFETLRFSTVPPVSY